MELAGQLKEVFDTYVVSEKFKKREFVVTTGYDTQYPQDIILQVVNERCDSLDNLIPGMKVTVQFNIRGRKHTDRYFNTLEVWRIELK
ncbi:MAG: hypothetical protein K0S44_251 [Bacteroidetes bacterium]|jgi:hypothetical protein|nr:hypothetical protein [Bacteroidota bacterium]